MAHMSHRSGSPNCQLNGVDNIYYECTHSTEIEIRLTGVKCLCKLCKQNKKHDEITERIMFQAARRQV